MKESLLSYIVCPTCSEHLRLKPSRAQEQWIEEGILQCPQKHWYPIIAGVPILIEEKLRCSILGDEEISFRRQNQLPVDAETTRAIGEKQKAAQVWGYQWQNFADLWQDGGGQDQFYRWIAPLKPQDLRDKTLLDAGCGTGRHVLYSSNQARLVIGADISLASRVASRLTKDRPNAHIVQADIYHLPFAPETFDRVYSIGVIHHLPDPQKAYLGLRRLVKETGTLTVWLYGRENNWLAARFVEWFRRHCTRHMPLALLKWLAFFPAFLLYLIIRFIYAPLDRRLPSLAQKFPYHQYFMLFYRLSLRHQWMNVFDKLNAPIAHYYCRQDMQDWLKKAALADTLLTHTNDISWTLHGKKSL